MILVTAPHLPAIGPLVMETGLGKRSCEIDLRTPDGKHSRPTLMRQADVLIQGCHPGGLKTLGFGPEQAALASPGIIYVTLSAYGHDGPWAGRRVLSTSCPPAAQALKRASGYLMASAVMATLMRLAAEGGSWHIRVSLAQTGAWPVSVANGKHG